MSLDSLRKWLNTLPSGAIKDVDQLTSLLAESWSTLNGGDATRMEPWKLGRVEEPQWEPPLVTFQIERHGAFVKGSKRAEMQKWTVNIESGDAGYTSLGKRQLIRSAKPLDIQPLVDAVVGIIQAGVKDDPRVTWMDDGSVRVNVAHVIPDKGGPKETLAGRRKRFRDSLRAILKTLGWQEHSVYRFIRAETSSTSGT